MPLRTGPYRFTLCADEQAELRLSSSPAPDLARRLVNLASPVAPVAWQTRPEQTSESQNLVSGQWYYVELLLKEERGDDHAEVGWTGPGIAKPTVIDGRFLVPWGGAAHRARQAYELVQAAIAAEQRTNAAAYRYGAAALALTATRNQLQDAQARAEMDAAIARFGLLAQLRDHVQATLARTPQRSIWAMPRGLADVTGANDEGLTVAPGMIVAWSDVPPKQMLQLVNRVAPRAEGDAAAQARIALAAALFGLETGDHIEQILKHREHAIGLGDRDVTELANRLLGDPASLRVSDALARFSRLADRQSGIPAQAERHLTDLGAGAGAGLVYAVWKEQAGSSLDDARKRSVLQTPPSEVLHLDNLEAPSNRGDKFLARFQGYLIAPETGLYTFRLTCDDQGELWLGTNTAPASLQLLVRQTRAHGNRKWEEGGDQKSKPVPLVQGRRYRIEALHKEDGQTDHLSVAWQAPSATRPALLSSNHLACVFDGSLPATVATTRRKAVDDLLRLQDLAHGILQAREASVALAAGPALADQVATLQSWVALAETQARESDELLRRLGPALPALKSALRAKR